jgi:transcriptional regulator with XRE-family HTH domain
MSTGKFTEKFSVKPKFGPVLRTIRQKRGISLRDLANQIGVDHTYISQIELGKVGPPVGQISIRIARILDSPELMRIAEYIAIRQLLIAERQRDEVYQELPVELRNELGITDAEMKEITDMCSRLTVKLLDALDRMQRDSSMLKQISQRKGTSKRQAYRIE